ncbi:unnamed protein product [Thlaspi arvense]|uniref:Bifunctional inhibitor/plant lipid transfer protein/seed storage helical domain-containing protein n=1 Tax=Thlaspi arvense TaxID=13288 RepID=A0AAU9SUT6_THLAR|nr:unnamed protein product [Thlaspi arvense]
MALILSFVEVSRDTKYKKPTKTKHPIQFIFFFAILYPLTLAMSQTPTTTASTMTIVLITVFLIVATSVTGQGEAAPPPIAGMVCGADLGLCAAALVKGGKPSEQCCTGLDKAVKTQVKCLCDILMNPKILAGFNLTVENALLIPKSCGIDAGSSMCSGPPEDDKGVATKLAGTGLVGIALMTISMIFY